MERILRQDTDIRCKYQSHESCILAHAEKLLFSKTYSIFHIDLMVVDHSGPNPGPKILQRRHSEYERVLQGDEHVTRIAPVICFHVLKNDSDTGRKA